VFWDHELKAILGEERAHQLPSIRASEGHTPSLPSSESKLPPSAGKGPRKESRRNHSHRAASAASGTAGLVYATLLVAFAVMSVLANWYFQLPAAR
jgi:hypothetical protein